MSIDIFIFERNVMNLSNSNAKQMTYAHAAKLLARITPFSTKAVFDPTQYAGEFEHVSHLLQMA